MRVCDLVLLEKFLANLVNHQTESDISPVAGENVEIFVKCDFSVLCFSYQRLSICCCVCLGKDEFEVDAAVEGSQEPDQEFHA